MSNCNCSVVYVCPECGSENVLEPTWVYTNGLKSAICWEVIGHRVEGVDFDLCEDCHAQMTIIPKEEYIEKEIGYAYKIKQS